MTGGSSFHLKYNLHEFKTIEFNGTVDLVIVLSDST